MNKIKLKVTMLENNDDREFLSKALGITISTLSKKMNERSGAGFTQPEILLLKY